MKEKLNKKIETTLKKEIKANLWFNLFSSLIICGLVYFILKDAGITFFITSDGANIKLTSFIIFLFPISYLMTFLFSIIRFIL